LNYLQPFVDKTQPFRREPDGISKTDLWAILGRNKTAGDARMILSILRENELADCIMTATKTSKKPTEIWFSYRYANKFINS